MADGATEFPSWMDALGQAIDRGDPLLFATGVLGFLMPNATNKDRKPQLEPWQVVALRKFRKAWRNRFERKGRLSIKSGHGVGKTCFLSVIILFCLFAGGFDVKIPVVANSQDQLRDGLWPELNKWRDKLPDGLKAQITWEKEKVYLTAAPEGVFAVRRTASKHRPEALQGIHAETVLAIFEEASGIPEETIEAGAGTLSTPGALAVAVGNPTRRTGFFARTHTDPELRATWDRMTVNSEDVPRARGHIEDIIKLYGKDSNKYRVRVLGELPTKDDDVVIPLEWAEAAKGRKIKATHCFPVWGCDPSRFGDDRTTLLKRQGNILLACPIVWQNLDGGQIAGRIVAEYRATTKDMRPKAICVDVIGIGASVVDFLSRDPELEEDDVAIIAVNVAEASAIGALDHRLRDEIWWKAREWFQNKDCCIVVENMTVEQMALINEFIGELTTPTYDYTAAGKRIVQSKKEYKADFGRSPDLADGFIITFAAPVYPRPVERHRRDRHQEKFTEPGSAWGAQSCVSIGQIIAMAPTFSLPQRGHPVGACGLPPPFAGSMTSTICAMS